MAKKQLSISISPVAKKWIDDNRGTVPRVKFLEQTLEQLNCSWIIKDGTPVPLITVKTS